ncbi:glycosyl transferase [Aeromicrobium sp. PE09-221]|uniref:glycosyltransferase n=1 Tax=Aeromicrobium sp. PE09-221 TaxID=1898043 RepID=UPI000B3E71ED|nr:glycosyltransferase [Aeromicrobium sp. PE09-221]OUZ07281.1 glycosyl transferase [Aeromicrobium sp. PE09-221]
MSHVLAHVVFPADGDPDVMPLYADPETWTTIDGETVRVSNATHLMRVESRHSIRVRRSERVSFASYFNAFPAAYWQRWTRVESVTLTLRTEGSGTVTVYRSNPQGVQQRMAFEHVEGDHDLSFELPVRNFSDGGWYWFDVTAAETDVVVSDGAWSTDTELGDGTLSIGITTFNKADYCVRTLETLADAPEVVEQLDRVYVVDQGTQLVAEADGYTEVAARLGSRLQIVRQPNLGGSGGFSRAMSETVEAGRSSWVMLLDDDVEIEPESIWRTIQFSRASRRPTIVGGHMFDLLDKPVLHAWAEGIEMDHFLWAPTFPEQHRHDFRAANLRQTPWMHTRQDATYNGWWMCTIPVEVIEKVGLALPVFIKWDDSEYALRAREAGYPTVSLPGAALWHVSWLDKDDAQDWQAYYHARNRLLAAMLHSPFPGGGRLVKASRRIDLKHLISMQYYAIELRHRALRDLLAGPSHLDRDWPSVMPELRAYAQGFSETQVITDVDALPTTREGQRHYPYERAPQAPRGIGRVVFTAKAALRHWIRPTDSAAEPQVELSKHDAAWWRVPGFDSALISAADGRGKSVYRRDRAEYRRLLRESIALHKDLADRWDELAAQYRAALPDLTSRERWHRTFEG